MAGTGITLTLRVDFSEAELRKELMDSLREDEPKLTNAVQAVFADAKYALESHVQRDVYDQFQPKEYIRTGAIIDIDGSVLGGASVGSGGFSLQYKPSGASEQWRNPAHGDDLIRRIESGSGYEWRRRPGPRPFWKNFVEEMLGGAFAEAYDAAMAAQFGSDYEGGTVVIREAGDGEY